MKSNPEFYYRTNLHRFGPVFLALLLTLASVPATDASYLPASRDLFDGLLSPPPLAGSAEQAADLAQTIAMHKARSAAETEMGNAEKDFFIFSFAPAIGEILHPGAFPKTEALFHQVEKETKTAVDEQKDYWKRPRPYVVEPSLAPEAIEKSFGYPSGHSTRATVFALLLAELFPADQEEVLKIGRSIGWHRVILARHYPTDIYAGRVLAQAIVRKLKANADFQRDFAEVKAEIQLLKAARHESADSGVESAAGP